MIFGLCVYAVGETIERAVNVTVTHPPEFTPAHGASPAPTGGYVLPLALPCAHRPLGSVTVHHLGGAITLLLCLGTVSQPPVSRV